ncbi:MAG: hypothetical protein OHK0056_32840 [Bacteriovoracaceae bacterium]
METLKRRALIFDYLCTRDENSPASISDVFNYFKENHDISETRKTFERDITDYLSKDHQVVEVKENKKTNRYYAIRDKKSPLHNIKIERKDLFALVTAISTFKHTAPDVFAKSCDNILLSLGKNVKEEDQENFSMIRSITTSTQGIDGKSEAINSDDFKTLIDAIINFQCFECRIAYPLSEEKSEIKRYMPLSFYFTNNTPYLYALDLKKNVKRLLRATRLVDVSLLDQKADPKKVLAALIEVGPHFSGFDAKAEINYKITCDEAFATFFKERPFVKPYSLSPKGKDYILSFTLNNNDQLIRLFASWSPHIKDISPKEVKNQVKELLKLGLSKLS